MITVVQLPEYEAADRAFFVEWEQPENSRKARFELALGHPLSKHLRSVGVHRNDVRLVVASTAEVEWHVWRVTWSRFSCVVELMAHSAWVLNQSFPDEFLVEQGMVL